MRRTVRRRMTPPEWDSAAMVWTPSRSCTPANWSRKEEPVTPSATRGRPVCAVLDDYQGVALSMADWSGVSATYVIRVVTEPMGDLEQVRRALVDCRVVVAMRERTPFPATLLADLPELRLLVTTGMNNASIDLGYVTGDNYRRFYADAIQPGPGTTAGSASTRWRSVVRRPNRPCSAGPSSMRRRHRTAPGARSARPGEGSSTARTRRSRRCDKVHAKPSCCTPSVKRCLACRPASGVTVIPAGVVQSVRAGTRASWQSGSR